MEKEITNDPIVIDAVARPISLHSQPENNDPNSLPANTDTGTVLKNSVQENAQQIDVQSSNSGCLSLSNLTNNIIIFKEQKQNDSSGSLEEISKSPDDINSVEEQQQKDTAGSFEVISESPNIITDTPQNDDVVELNISPNIISDTPQNDDAVKLNIGQNFNNKNAESSDHDIFSLANDGQCKINDSHSVIESSNTDVVVNSFLPCNTTPTFSTDFTASKISVDPKCESSGGSCQDKSSGTGPTDERPFKRQKIEDIPECSSVMETETKELAIEEERIESVNTSNTQEEKVAAVYQFRNEPRQITGAWKCFKNDNINNYMRGCKWAPDGTCLLVNSNDNIIRMFNLPEELYYEGGERKVIPELVPVFGIKEVDTVYDFSWFPLMSSTDPAKACFAVTSKDTPIHLYDAFTGQLRCTYRAYNHVDEVVAAHCVEFSCDGNKIYAGFNKIIRVFDVTRPGREFKSRPTFAKEGQRGIISCIAPSPTDIGLYAAGSYAKSVALYNEPMGEMVCMFEGQQGGVTQVKFSPDGTKLYSGGRKDNEILCWDMRNPGQILFTLNRQVSTNQRIYFDITGDSRYVVSGSHDGNVLVWDTLSPPQHDPVLSDPVIHPTMRFQAHFDTVNGISLHPTLSLIATASGQRHFKCTFDSDDDDSDSGRNSQNTPDNSLRLWWV